jgi:hypothetical protein
MSRQRCELCGRWLRVVGSRHLARVHGMTLADYRRIVERDQAGPAGGQLADGTPYFGKLGEMAYDPDTDLMQCHLCGKWLKWVGGMHLKYRHDGWTIADYRHAFGLSASQSTVAAHSRTLLRAHAIERLDRARLGSPLGDGGLQAKRWKSLAERRPELVSELHPDRNGDLDPTTLGVWSSERVWWRCRDNAAVNGRRESAAAPPITAGVPHAVRALRSKPATATRPAPERNGHLPRCAPTSRPNCTRIATPALTRNSSACCQNRKSGGAVRSARTNGKR